MQNVFIIGGTSGIGWHLAQLYLDNGDRVAIASRNPDKDGIDFTRITNLEVYQVDVVDKKALQDCVVDFCKDQKLDIIVNSAGCYIDSALHNISFEESQQMLQINIQGALNTLEVGSQFMQNTGRGGKIALIASISALMDYPMATIYSKTKRSILILADAYYRALKPFNIHVSCICPGYVATAKLFDLNQGDLSKKQFVITPAQGAQHIYTGLEQNQKMIVFPKRMHQLIRMLNWLPTFALQKIMYKKAKWQTKK